MSLGNRKGGGNHGNKNSGHAYELGVIRQLGEIIAGIDGLALELTAEQINLNTDTLEASNDAIQAAAELIRDYLAPTTRTNTIVTSVGPGSIPAGAVVGSVFNNGAANGTFDGATVPPGVTIPLPLCHQGDTYPIINYDGTGTSLIIQYTS